MDENKLFEALLDVVPFAAYAVDIDSYEVVYANKKMVDNMYAPKEEFCWKKIFGQEEACSWCTIAQLKQREKTYKNDKLLVSFFDEATDSWLQSYDELVKWPDGRTVKYSIAVDITEQKEIQANMIQSHTKLAIQSKKLKDANEKLEFLAKKDYLTKVNNRGNFFSLGNKLFQKNTSDDTFPIFVAMFDLDKFKSINDKYGHNIGDKALQAFSEAVQEHINPDKDIFGRLGGEEFALIVDSYCEKNITDRLEKIRKSVEKITIKTPNDTLHFTVSIGLVKKLPNETLDEVLNRADQLMYTAKKDGRNKLKFRI
jgi:diguanylate cyclase (GGDEF)-like protein